MRRGLAWTGACEGLFRCCRTNRLHSYRGVRKFPNFAPLQGIPEILGATGGRRRAKQNPAGSGRPYLPVVAARTPSCVRCGRSPRLDRSRA
jgi:hypothetical protein